MQVQTAIGLLHKIATQGKRDLDLDLDELLESPSPFFLELLRRHFTKTGQSEDAELAETAAQELANRHNIDTELLKELPTTALCLRELKWLWDHADELDIDLDDVITEIQKAGFLVTKEGATIGTAPGLTYRLDTNSGTATPIDAELYDVKVYADRIEIETLQGTTRQTWTDISEMSDLLRRAALWFMTTVTAIDGIQAETVTPLPKELQKVHGAQLAKPKFKTPTLAEVKTAILWMNAIPRLFSCRDAAAATLVLATLTPLKVALLESISIFPHVLLYGPPLTGKTTLARTAAAFSRPDGKIIEKTIETEARAAKAVSEPGLVLVDEVRGVERPAVRDILKRSATGTVARTIYTSKGAEVREPARGALIMTANEGITELLSTGLTRRVLAIPMLTQTNEYKHAFHVDLAPAGAIAATIIETAEDILAEGAGTLEKTALTATMILEETTGTPVDLPIENLELTPQTIEDVEEPTRRFKEAIQKLGKGDITRLPGVYTEKNAADDFYTVILTDTAASLAGLPNAVSFRRYMDGELVKTNYGVAFRTTIEDIESWINAIEVKDTAEDAYKEDPVTYDYYIAAAAASVACLFRKHSTFAEKLGYTAANTEIITEHDLEAIAFLLNLLPDTDEPEDYIQRAYEILAETFTEKNGAITITNSDKQPVTLHTPR